VDNSLIIENLLYLLRRGLYDHPSGMRGKFRFLLLPLGGDWPRVSSQERMFPLVLGVNSHSQLVRPLGGILLATAGRRTEDLAPSPCGLVLIDEVVLPMTQRPLLTPQSRKERG